MATAGTTGAREAEDKLEASFQRSFALVAYIANRHLVDHFMRARRSLGVDFDELVLWAVVAHQNVAHFMPPGTPPHAVLDSNGSVKDFQRGQLRPVRLRHLAEITGVPRETARRKLANLREAGWLRQESDGWVVNADQVDPLRAFTLETVRRLLATAREVERVLNAAADDPAS